MGRSPICDIKADIGNFIVRWGEVSTVTGRQLEFETVDLEALREAFRDSDDRKRSGAQTFSADRSVSEPITAEKKDITDGSMETAEKADINFTDSGAETAEEANIDLTDGGAEAADKADIEFTDSGAETVEEANIDLTDGGAEAADKADADLTDGGMESLTDAMAAGEGQDETAPVYFEEVIGQLSKKYEDKHRMSLELSSDVFSAIGKAKAAAREEHEEAVRKVSDASAVVDDATRKLRIIEKRYEKARHEELIVKRELQSLPYVAEAAITEARKDIERERNELAGFVRDLPRAEQFEVTARAEALTALRAVLEPESYAAEKKKALDEAEKLRDLTDYLLTVAKKSQDKEKLEAEYAAARREASIRNAAYSEAYREYSRAESLLEDARSFAREKRNMYETAHKDTMRIRKKIDAFTDLIDAEEKKVSSMVKASARYDRVFAVYQERKKTRFAKGRQLDAARTEYARLLSVLSEAKNKAENAADRMYRAEKISVRDVIETDVKDPDFLYLNRYGALLAKAQADEQAALGELRRAQKKSDTV